MDLKCIGGECDGQIQYVDDYRLSIGDQVQVYKPIKVEIKNISLKDQLEENITMTIFLYRICAIHGTGHNREKLTLKYLCPTDWHEWEAIQHQFMK